jgi:hypothetical protein
VEGGTTKVLIPFLSLEDRTLPFQGYNLYIVDIVEWMGHDNRWARNTRTWTTP